MSDRDESNCDDFTLVMPFVVCRSEGGPYDDPSFVAGVRFAHMQAALDAKPPMFETYQPPGLVPQLDLLAMERGYLISVDDLSDEWARVTLRRVPAGDA